ncbi:MAG: hypothetical protein K0U74_12185 [Alphaproteobacteria bacterium]|nr:hypothetical protein [Alphaproteobacteria bacterium]
MKQPTLEQLTTAENLLASIEKKQNRIRNLKALITAAELAEGAEHSAIYAAINYDADPNRLTNACAHYQRANDVTRQTIDQSYRFLLASMAEALLPGGKPRKVDFDALQQAARPFLLGPFLNLTVGKVFPRLCLKTSDPDKGKLTYIVSGGPVESTEWRQQIPAMNAWLGGEWTVECYNATTITFLRREPLPDVIPFDPAMLKDGHLFLGIDVEKRVPFYVPISEMTHTLVCGTTGMGKSNGLHILLRSFLHNIEDFDAVHLVCGKGGVAFRRYTGIHPKVHTYSEPEELWKLASDLVVEMKARNARMVERAEDNTYSGFIALVIDEFGAFNICDNPDRKSDEHKAHHAFMTAMMHLGKRGRSTGIRLVLTTQEPTERDISAGIKNVLPSVLVFRLPLVQHATSVFGDLADLPSNPRCLNRGHAIFRSTFSHHAELLQVPLFSTQRVHF